MHFTLIIGASLILRATCFSVVAPSNLQPANDTIYNQTSTTGANTDEVGIAELDSHKFAAPQPLLSSSSLLPLQEDESTEHHGLEFCTVVSDLVPEFISTRLPEPATRPPKSCKDYDISREFIPSTNASADQLFKAGFDLNAEKLYICKALVNGVEYLGRGSIQGPEFKKCWLDIGTHEVLIGDKFSYLRKPEGVRLLWKNAGGQEHGLNPLEKGKGNEKWLGRTIFQPPVKNGQFSDCMTKSEDGEVLIPGFVESSNPSRLRFTFGSNAYLSADFMLLTCAELNQNEIINK